MPHMKFRNSLKLLVLLSVPFSMSVYAENADRNKPIEISADNGTLDQQQQVTVWTGNVVVIQGTLKFTADKVTVSRTPAGDQTMVATGNPVTFRQKLEGKPQYITGRASRVDYNSKTNTVVLTGNAQVEREGDIVKGAVITYNTETEFYSVNGGAGQKKPGRVTVVLQPSTTQKK